MEVPFGMNSAKPDLVMAAYMHNSASYLNTVRNGLDTWAIGEMPSDARGFPFPLVFDAIPHMSHSSTYDRTFAFAPFYSVCDTFKIEAAVFQDRLGRANGRWLPARHTDDPGVSFAGRLTYTPVEALALYASAVTRYNKNAKAQNEFFIGEGEPFRDRMYATSLGFSYTYDICGSGRVFNIFGEWQHAWNPNFLTRTRSDNFHAGISYSVTSSWRLLAQFEYLRMADKFGPGPNSKEHVRRAYLATQYDLSEAAFLEAGFQREWYKDNAAAPFRTKAYANAIYASMGLRF